MAAYAPEEEPLDPAAERLRRKLVRLLLVSGGIMMLGLIAVFSAIVYKLGEGAPQLQLAGTSGAPVQAGIAVPAGSRLVSMALDGNRALLHLEGADRSASLVLVDLTSGKQLGRYQLRPD